MYYNHQKSLVYQHWWSSPSNKEAIFPSSFSPNCLLALSLIWEIQVNISRNGSPGFLDEQISAMFNCLCKSPQAIPSPNLHPSDMEIIVIVTLGEQEYMVSSIFLIGRLQVRFLCGSLLKAYRSGISPGCLNTNVCPPAKKAGPQTRVGGNQGAEITDKYLFTLEI